MIEPEGSVGVQGGAEGIVNYFTAPESARRYATGRPSGHARVLEVLQRELASHLPVERALDVGCGTGHSTVALLPFGLLGGGEGLADAGVLWRGVLVALLSSVVPYALELAALQLIRASTFGILMSLEPAVAALCGAVFIGQGIRGLELLAIVFVVAASVGSSLRVGKPASSPL